MEQILHASRTVTGLMGVAMSAFFVASGVSSLTSVHFLTFGGHEGHLPNIDPTPRHGVVHRSGNEVCQRNVFDSSLRPCEQPLAPPQPDNQAVPPLCEPSVSLIGTMVSSHDTKSLALLRRDQEFMVVGIGEILEGQGQVRRIGWRLVLVEDESGGECLLDLYGPPREGRHLGAHSARPVSPAPLSSTSGGVLSASVLDDAIEVISPSARRVSKRFVEEVLSDPGRVLKAIRARALVVTEGGQMRGFRLYGIPRGSLLSRLGLRSGDVVNSVNNIEMTSLDRPLEALTALRHADNFSVGVTRRGRREVLRFDLR